MGGRVAAGLAAPAVAVASVPAVAAFCGAVPDLREVEGVRGRFGTKGAGSELGSLAVAGSLGGGGGGAWGPPLPRT